MFDKLKHMSIRKMKFVSGEYYHIYNRGNSKQKLFLDKEDYTRFISLLYACNQKSTLKVNNLSKDKTLYDIDRDELLVFIGAYCLMPNHFHLVVTQSDNADTGISTFLQKVSTAYSMYFNKKYKRVGSLFEGKFRSQYADSDVYLKYLFSYIHLNPVKLIQKDWKEVGIKNKKETIDYLNKYSYSSYLDYLGESRIQNRILDRKHFPKYFPSKNLFIKDIFEWLSFRDRLVE